jgi:hypothetical protein
MWKSKSLDCYVFKQHKPWFEEECSKLLNRRKQAKLQWLQNPSETNGDKNIKDLGINEFRKGYQPRTNFTKRWKW